MRDMYFHPIESGAFHPQHVWYASLVRLHAGCRPHDFCHLSGRPASSVRKTVGL